MKKVPLSFFVLLFGFMGIVQASFGKDLALQFHNNSFQGKKLTTEVTLVGEISYDTLDAIRNGITANLLITVQLIKTRGLFESGKEMVKSNSTAFTVSYDVWENRFVLYDKEEKREYRAAYSSELVNEISSIISPLSIRISSVEQGKKFVFRGKIKIQTIKLFPPFGIFLYFFDPWNYESGWNYGEYFSVASP